MPDSNLVLGVEQLGAAAGASVDAGAMLVPIGAGEGLLGSLLSEDAVLVRGELGRHSASDFVSFSVVIG